MIRTPKYWAGCDVAGPNGDYTVTALFRKSRGGNVELVKFEVTKPKAKRNRKRK